MGLVGVRKVFNTVGYNCGNKTVNWTDEHCTELTQKADTGYKGLV